MKVRESAEWKTLPPVRLAPTPPSIWVALAFLLAGAACTFGAAHYLSLDGTIPLATTAFLALVGVVGLVGFVLLIGEKINYRYNR